MDPIPETKDLGEEYDDVAKGRMPRYTYYLSNYHHLLSSAKYGISNSGDVDDRDSSPPLSPKFGIEATDPSLYDYVQPQINGVYPELDARASPEEKSSSLFCAFDTEDELACASAEESYVVPPSKAADAAPLGNLELENASIIESVAASGDSLEWTRKYASGNFATFKSSQQRAMQEIRQKVDLTLGQGDVAHYSFPVKCVFTRGKCIADETFDLTCIKQGDVLVGRFQIHRIIGSTNFSTVLQASDSELKLHVCLKITGPNFVAQALDEINLLKILSNTNGSHDSIVELLDYFYFRGCLFTVLELLGPNLYEATRLLTVEPTSAVIAAATNGNIAPVGPVIKGWSLDAVRSIAKDILNGLVHLHKHGIINCDLKPENVVLVSSVGSLSDLAEADEESVKKLFQNPRCKLIDFGGSCFIQDRLSTYVQSRSYRAPEVVLGLPYDTKIDTWSLGCLLCELYLVRVLFPSDNDATLMASMISLLGVPPVHLLEHKMNSSFMVLPNGTVADFSVPNTILSGFLYKNRTATSVACQDSACDSLDFTSSKCDGRQSLQQSQVLSPDLGIPNTVASESPSRRRICREQLKKLEKQQQQQLSPQQPFVDSEDFRVKLDICRGNKGPKIVRITKPSACSIDAMLDSHKSQELSDFASFLKGLLQYDPIDRLDAPCALEHAFLKNY